MSKRTFGAIWFFVFAVLASIGLYVSAPRLFVTGFDRQLILSVESRDASTTRILLSKGANPNGTYYRSQRYVDAQPLLSFAVINDDRENLDTLLDGGARINEPDWCGRTALMLAIEHQNYALASYLLDRGADPAIKDRHGKTAYDRLQSHIQRYPELRAKLIPIVH